LVDALIFDVFGTCVDWRQSIARQVRDVLPGVDPLAFADEWRGEYQPGMARIRSGERGYAALDDLHLENLEVVLARWGVSVADPGALARAWERLDAWPDVVAGLTRLQRGYPIAPCSNGSIALMTQLARYAGLPWSCILGAEIAQNYKPEAVVYQASCAALRLPTNRVVMVAAHNDDLAAARRAGLKTAFVLRPTEHGDTQQTDLEPAAKWDWIADDFDDLADQLGV